MPVRFKATSEYQSHFTQAPPEKTACVTPTMKGLIPTPAAGLCTEKLNFDSRGSMDCEPAFQRKKRSTAPVSSLSCEFYDTSKPAPDEYILLGNNEKFVENIRYRNRNSNNCKNVGEFNFNRDVSPPKIQKSLKENIVPNDAPAPVVDTSLFKKGTSFSNKGVTTPSTPLTPRETKPAEIALKYSEPADKNNYDTKKESKDTSKREEKDNLRKNITRVLRKEKESGVRIQAPVKRPINPRMRTYVKPWVISQDRLAQNAAAAKSKGKAAEDTKSKKTQEKGQSEQTVVEVNKGQLTKEVTQGQSSSNEDAVREGNKEQANDANYGLKYKAGVSRNRKAGPTRLSEYQREFEWKNAVKSSPLMDAEQMLFKSSVNSATVNPDLIPKMSEYRAQFKEYPFIKDDLLTPQPGPTQPKHPAKVKRSKSAGAINESQEDEEVISPDPRQALGEEVKAKHGKYRKRVKSEYEMNFQAPWNYEYVDGAWRKASPPQVQLSGDTEETEAAQEPTTSWFKEVIELRQKADEYRKRARGTHFSREHLVQLMARQAELWDQLSEGSRTLSALSLEAHASRSQRPQLRNEDVEQQSSEVVSPQSTSMEKIDSDERAKFQTYTKKRSGENLARKLDYSSGETVERDEPENSNEPDNESEDIVPLSTNNNTRERSVKGSKSGGKSKKAGKKVKQGKKKQAGKKALKSAWSADDEVDMERVSPDAVEEDEGRIPTPTLRQRSSSSQSVRRHHLDRTTPSVGGALLTSPPPQRKAFTSPHVFGSGYQSCDDDSDQDTLKDERITQPVITQGRTSVKKTFNFSKENASPTFGLPSYDSHFLRDDAASTDRPLNTKYIQSPQKQTSDSDDEDDLSVRGQSQGQGSSKGGMGVTYKMPSQSKGSSGPRPFAWSLDGGNFVPRRTYSDDEDDILSVSARSVASSSSLASEVLERAQRRHQDFWGRGGSQTR